MKMHMAAVHGYVRSEYMSEYGEGRYSQDNGD